MHALMSRLLRLINSVAYTVPSHCDTSASWIRTVAPVR